MECWHHFSSFQRIKIEISLGFSASSAALLAIQSYAFVNSDPTSRCCYVLNVCMYCIYIYLKYFCLTGNFTERSKQVQESDKPENCQIYFILVTIGTWLKINVSSSNTPYKVCNKLEDNILIIG